MKLQSLLAGLIFVPLVSSAYVFSPQTEAYLKISPLIHNKITPLLQSARLTQNQFTLLLEVLPVLNDFNVSLNRGVRI